MNRILKMPSHLIIISSKDPENDFVVDKTHLEKISFTDINISDVIKVTNKSNWDYCHINEIITHLSEPNNNYSIGKIYHVGTTVAGLQIFKDTDWLLERVEMNVAYELLRHYRQNWPNSEISNEEDPRAVN